MYFKCSIAGISAEQLAACSAIETLYLEQSMPCVVKSLDPMVFELKPHLSAMMRERLMANRVESALHGYTGKIEGNELVVQKEASAEPVVSRRKRAS